MRHCKGGPSDLKNWQHANSIFAFFVFFDHFCSQLFPLMLPWLFKNETYRYFTSFHFWAPGLPRFGEGGGAGQKEKERKENFEKEQERTESVWCV